MSVRIAINGLGRIGRSLLRVAHQRDGLELVAVNDLAPAGQLAGLLARETGRTPFSGQVGAAPGALRIDDVSIPLFRQPTPATIPWEETSAEIVIEASGAFSDRLQVADHLRGPVEHVILSANGREMDLTVCLGVNDELLDPRLHRMVSNASCTTNCLAVVLDVLERDFDLRRGLLNTVHCYNSSQSLIDAPHPDPRRARAAAINMIPTTTSAIAAIGRVLPGLEGRIDGFAVRVPTASVSLVDLVVDLAAEPDLEEIRSAFRAAAEGRLNGILAVTDDELVSSDFATDPHSATVDLPLLQAVEDRLYRIVAWYDNEWGYANRLADLVELIHRGRTSQGEI